MSLTVTVNYCVRYIPLSRVKLAIGRSKAVFLRAHLNFKIAVINLGDWIAKILIAQLFPTPLTIHRQNVNRRYYASTYPHGTSISEVQYTFLVCLNP